MALVSLGAVLCASACGTAPDTGVAADEGGGAGGSGASPDPSEFHQGAIPDELHPEIDEADLPREPEPDDSLKERMAWTALREITEFGGKVDPDAEASCPEIDGESGESVTCEVTYLDEEIDYQIDIEDNDSVLRYESTADGMPLLREVMEAGLRNFEESEYTVCDMDEVELVTPNEDTGIECRALNEEEGTVVSYTILPTESGAPTFVGEDTEFS
ncbi:hypothetical protein EFW17_20600 [Halostreptopolyspora alba]|uniref:DUF4333 domain-containing protein n=1 Tax=Halostreptopolyspora alba TaxID=2487137 RepID=A0A3N0E2H3_9ACTN|nr:hypothetical protein EFW17_20600 [Nocardiopsaceae bacterium YIM 96095]